MTSPPAVVRLHVLDTDVDVQLDVRGQERDLDEFVEAVRSRWHLAEREDFASAPVVVRALWGEAGAEREDDVVQDRELRPLLQRLTQAVTHAAIRARSGELLMLHAAALAHPDTGATAAFVAAGNTGKTTLCRTLGPELSYLSDETLGVRRDGTIAPYLKPLSTRRPDWAGVKDEQDPAALGLHPPRTEAWLAGVVLLRRDPDHEGPVRLEPLDTLDAVLALTPESSAFMRTEGPLAWLAELLERTGGAVRAVYAEVTDLAPVASEICGRVTGPVAVPPASLGDHEAGPQITATVAGPVYRTQPAHDELHRDGESLVLLDGEVKRVSPLGTLIRERARHGVTLTELAGALEEAFGLPPEGDITEVTAAAVNDLMGAGLLAGPTG